MMLEPLWLIKKNFLQYHKHLTNQLNLNKFDILCPYGFPLIVEDNQLVRKKLKEIEEKDHIRNFQPPINGKEIMDLFNISAGKEIGILKASIKDAILDGTVKNDKEEAMAFIITKAKELMYHALDKVVDYAESKKINIAIETEGSLNKKDHLLMQQPFEYEEFKGKYHASDIGINLVIKKTFKFYKFISDIRFGTGNDNCTADRVSV